MLCKSLQLSFDEVIVVLSLLNVVLDLEQTHGQRFPDDNKDHLALLNEVQAIEDALDGDAVETISEDNSRPNAMRYNTGIPVVLVNPQKLTSSVLLVTFFGGSDEFPAELAAHHAGCLQLHPGQEPHAKGFQASLLEAIAHYLREC